MNTTQWAGLIVSAMSIVAGFATLVRWLVKHYLYELKPNGGSSIKDKIKDIDGKVDKLELRIDAIYEMLLEKK
jgi:hypothetical protein